MLTIAWERIEKFAKSDPQHPIAERWNTLLEQERLVGKKFYSLADFMQEAAAAYQECSPEQKQTYDAWLKGATGRETEL